MENIRIHIKTLSEPSPNIPFEHTRVAQTASAVERRLTAELQQNRVGPLLLNDLRQHTWQMQEE